MEDNNDLVQSLSLDEALEIAARPVTWMPEGKPAASRRASGKGRLGQEWHGGHTFEEALFMARHGDQINALDIKRRLGQMVSFRTSGRATQRWDVAGSTVDMGRFMAGEPDNMIETIRARRPMPVMKLAIERAVSADVNPDTIRATGASVLAAVEALRTAGVASEIWVCFSTRGVGYHGGRYQTPRTQTTQVLIQEAGRPIDVDRLAFWVANPTAFRRIGFAIWEQWDRVKREEFNVVADGGYGYPTTPTTAAEYDEVAPARTWEVTPWLKDVLSRKAGITLLDKEDD